jgi:hypothetical protein
MPQIEPACIGIEFGFLTGFGLSAVIGAAIYIYLM